MTPALLRLPDTYSLWCGVDTGTYMSAVIGATTPDGDQLILDEVPNYRYVGGELELLGVTISEWAQSVVQTWQRFRPDQTCYAWADANTQFRAEYAQHGLFLQSNLVGLEARVEIAREYMQTKRVYLAPWLEVLPYELELARWPDDFTATGTYRRLKQDDHTLDCFEHGLSRRPLSNAQRHGDTPTGFLAQHLAKYRKPHAADPHLGRL